MNPTMQEAVLAWLFYFVGYVMWHRANEPFAIIFGVIGILLTVHLWFRLWRRKGDVNNG